MASVTWVTGAIWVALPAEGAWGAAGLWLVLPSVEMQTEAHLSGTGQQPPPLHHSLWKGPVPVALILFQINREAGKFHLLSLDSLNICFWGLALTTREKQTAAHFGFSFTRQTWCWMLKKAGLCGQNPFLRGASMQTPPSQPGRHWAAQKYRHLIREPLCILKKERPLFTALS